MSRPGDTKTPEDARRVAIAAIRRRARLFSLQRDGEEIESLANLATARACKHHNPALGSLTTIAHYSAKHVVSHYQEGTLKAEGRCNRRRAADLLSGRAGRVGEDGELVAAPPKNQEQAASSLDAAICGFDDLFLHEVIGTPDQAPAADLRADLGRALTALNKKLLEVLRLRFWDGLSFGECARLLGISREGVRHRELRALSILKDHMAGWDTR